jgi:hypothetical protein
MVENKDTTKDARQRVMHNDVTRAKTRVEESMLLPIMVKIKIKP